MAYKQFKFNLHTALKEPDMVETKVNKYGYVITDFTSFPNTEYEGDEEFPMEDYAVTIIGRCRLPGSGNRKVEVYHDMNGRFIGGSNGYIIPPDIADSLHLIISAPDTWTQDMVDDL